MIQGEASDELEALSDSNTVTDSPQVARPTISAEGRAKRNSTFVSAIFDRCTCIIADALFEPSICRG
jgi:hypothetical protein